MELKDTMYLMMSESYTNRFKAEYYQLSIRIEKLQSMINKYENDELNFKPNCSITLLKRQLKSMKDYLETLQLRAVIENIML